jgi:hypothetical protein
MDPVRTRELGLAAVTRAQEFRWSHVAEGVLSLYREVTARTDFAMMGPTVGDGLAEGGACR